MPYPRRVAEQDIKRKLLQTLVASQDREREIEELCNDAPAPAPATWTAKDHLAHLAHWRRHATRVLAAAHGGGPIPASDDIDAINAEVHAANQKRSAADVKEVARASYRELEAAIEACTDEELARPRPGTNGAVWEVVPGNGHLHLGEHLGFWHQAQGDERAAEAAQLWVRDVQGAAFTDPRSLAFGAYNLGCYYARLGRAADAIPHFKRSFELLPELKDWAHTDKDLDRIRDEPELRSILA